MWRSKFFSILRFCLVVGLIPVLTGGNLFSADKARIKAAILKGQKFLLQQQLTGASGSIAALAYVKSGGDKKAPAVQQIVQEIFDKVKTGSYSPREHHNYEAAVDLMLLEAVGEGAFREQMTLIVTYVLERQQPNGSWYYPTLVDPDCGDTSITQYAVMGLWAAVRSKIPVPVEVWEKAARWHLAKQKEDGGFAYHPFDQKSSQDADANISSATMAAAGSSSLLIIRRILFHDSDLASEVRPTAAKRRFGVLERFTDDKPIAVVGEVSLRLNALDKSLKESVNWMTAHFGEKSKRHDLFFCYHLYSIERVAALLDVAKFGSHDWYDEGADELLRTQLPNGSWNDLSSSVPATSMGLMFLSKATTSIVTPAPRVNLLGGGLQAGGRGLPDNLDSVEMKDGSVSSRKIVGAVDNLLIELERSADAKVEDVQAAIVESIQLDHPEELIGQTARLLKLATDQRTEVRRTALWALGRSGDVMAAPMLIQGLSDPDLSIAREASLGLCILSRRPEGCGKPIDPTEDSQMGIKDNATDAERKTALDAWRTESKNRWTDWYHKHRPYDERDDRTTLKRNTVK